MLTVSMSQIPSVLKTIADWLHIPADVAKQLIPFTATMCNAAINMYSLNLLMLGEQVDLQGKQLHLSGEERPLFGGQCLCKSKDAVGGADAFKELIDDINNVCDAAGPQYEQGQAKNFNITSFSGQQEGFTSDQCQIETLMID
eukprot:2813611-Rhodomonas_salina.1